MRSQRWRNRGRALALAAVAAGTVVLAGPAAGASATAAPVTSPPPATVSDYVMAADDTPAALLRLGCTQAKAEPGPERGRSRLVTLDFGGQYGTGSVLLIPPPVGTAPNTELTYAQVAADAVAYAAGYRGCVAAGAGPLVVGIATNNSLNTSGALGAEWADDVVNPAQELASRAFPHGSVTMAASDDIEPGFGAAAPARQWVAGYVAASEGNALYNIGSADGCSGSTMAGTCNNGWTVGDEYAVNAGLGPRLLRAVPEIYTESGIMAAQWQGISAAGPAAGQAPVRFAGVLTQHGTCQIPGITWCTGIDNTPVQGWDQLYADLNASPATAQRSLPWSTDITYSSVPAVSGSTAPGTSAGPFVPAGTGAGTSAPACTSGQLTVAFDGHGQYGARPLDAYPFTITNRSGSACAVDGAAGAAAVTRDGTALNLVPGGSTAPANASEQRTVLAPHASTGFALSLSDTGTHCRYLRQFTVRLPGVATPVAVPVTGMTGGAAVCGNRAASLTALSGH